MQNRVFRINIRGNINHETFDTLRLQFENKTWIYKPAVIAVSINSASGSQIQAKNISGYLHNKAAKYGVPVYTFAEDMCLNSANVILASGHKSFMNPMGLIGDYGYVKTWMGLKKAVAHYNIDVSSIKAGKYKDRMNTFTDLTANDEVFIKNVLDEVQYELKSEIINYRGAKFATGKFTNEEINNVVLGGDLLTAEKALNYKLVDKIASFDDEILHNFHDVKVLELQVEPKNDRRNSSGVNSLINFTWSKNR